MTEKQENILKAALTLFAEQGYAATSTSKVAKAAGVSEGLIFRHFGNKEGLLNAIMEQAKESAFKAYAPLLAKSDPKEMLRGLLSLVFTMEEKEQPLWRLVYALKWQTETYDHSVSAPIRTVLIDAFVKLGYENPNAEAELVLVLLDGIALAVLLRKPKNLEAVKTSLLAKYNL